MRSASYTHIQAAPEATWLIQHQLMGVPVFDVFVEVDGALQKTFPAFVDFHTNGSFTLTFSKPFAGKVRILGTATDILRSGAVSHIDADGVN